MLYCRSEHYAGLRTFTIENVYVYVYVLGALSLKQRAKRWLASFELDRGNRMGELEQPSAGRKQ